MFPVFHFICTVTINPKENFGMMIFMDSSNDEDSAYKVFNTLQKHASSKMGKEFMKTFYELKNNYNNLIGLAQLISDEEIEAEN